MEINDMIKLMQGPEFMAFIAAVRQMGAGTEVNLDELRPYLPQVDTRDFYLPRVGKNFYYDPNVFRKLLGLDPL